MPVTLAIPFRDAKKRPPPLPVPAEARAGAREQNTDASDAAASSLPPPLPSMRVPKAIVVRDAHGAEIDVHAAVLKARRATEELEWQAQVKRVKKSLTDSEAAEWEALHTRLKSVQVEATPRAQPPKKPARKLAVVPAVDAREQSLVASTAAPSAERVEQTVPVPTRVEQPAPAPSPEADEEHAWQELRARARLAEEREWQALIARARTNSVAPAHPFDAQPVQRQRPQRARPMVVAWP